MQAARERTTARKLQEIRYAVQLERELSKDEILNRYLNIAYFGSGAYGSKRLPWRYFGHSAKKLSPVEAATLAGVVQSPVGFDPLVNPEAAQVRRDEVLAKMEAQDFITPSSTTKPWPSRCKTPSSPNRSATAALRATTRSTATTP